MGRLEYDTSAFFYFLLAFVLFFLVPAAALWLKPSLALVMGSGARPKPPLPECDSWGPAQQRIIAQREQAHTASHAAQVKQAKIKLVLLALGTVVVLAITWMQGGDGKDIQQFDPFEILGISERASDVEIKKAYRKLSLQYHPDRWSTADKADKALAETRFVKVAKAYEALTDEVARENWKRYGNPDGRQALEMSIGLPSWLLDKDNQIYVILSYLLVFVVMFPAGLLLFSQQASNKTDARLAPDTEEIFRMAIRQVVPTVSIIDAFANSAEFRSLGYRSDDERQAVAELRKMLVSNTRMPAKPASHLFPMPRTDWGEKALVLTYIHMSRNHDKLTQDLLQDLDYILRQSPPLLRALVDHARTTCQAVTLKNAILFQQHFNQAMLVGMSPFLQIPHLSAKQSTNLAKKFDSSFEKFLEGQGLEQITLAIKQQEQEKAEEGAGGDINPSALADITTVCAHLPIRKIAEVQIGTIDDVQESKSGKIVDHTFSWFQTSAQGDIINVLFKLTRLRTSPYPYTKSRVAWTPFLPHGVKELWYVCLLNGPQPTGMTNLPSGKDKIVTFAVIPEDDETLMSMLVFHTRNNPNNWITSADWPMGVHKLKLHIFSNAYVGLDMEMDLTLTLIDPSKVPKIEQHAEDVELEHETVSLYQMLQPQVVNERDSDFEDEDENEQTAKDE